MVIRIWEFKINTLGWSVISICLIVHLYIKINERSRNNPCDNEPIDVVYTWVNGSDPKFLSELNEYIKLKSDKVDYSKQRFDDKNELKFSLRSLEKHAPWINHVFVVTNGQIPFWLNLDFEKITIVTHSEIFKSKHNLPTFSSPAIESNLHRIPGLSKKFIYFNDDIFIGQPIYPEDFYSVSKGYLVYLAWTVPGCTPKCPWLHVGDGQCDKSCNIRKCQFDGGDCIEKENDYFLHKDHDTENSSDDIRLLHNVLGRTFTDLFRHNSSTQSKLLPKSISSNKFSLNKNLQNKTDSVNSSLSFIQKIDKKVPIAKIVEQHNDNFLKRNKIHSRKRRFIFKKKNRFPDAPKNVDGYFESLQYTQKLLNAKYGFKVRRVPAHAPILIEREIMEKLQNNFPVEFEITERNKLRQYDDVQFGFSYYYFLMSERTNRSVQEIFDEFDTDDSGSWSDREIRNILTKMYELPLSYEVVDHFETILLNCSELKRYPDIPTPPYERYIDSKLPTITKSLVCDCPYLQKYLENKFGLLPRYKYIVSRNSESSHVHFKMLISNITHVVIQLDEVRQKRTKFICLNDNLDESKPDENELIEALLYDFYLSLFPHPSKFELPPDSRNRFLYMSELEEWKIYHYRTKIVLYVAIVMLVFVTFFNSWKKLFCKICSYIL